MNNKRVTIRKIMMSFVTALCVVFVFCVNTETLHAANKKSITLNEVSKTLNKGETTTITVKTVKGLKSKKVSFKSSNNKVATVSSKGVVKAKKKGSATITVTSKEDKKVKAKFKVKVTEFNISKFLKNNNAKIRKIGTTYTQKGLFHNNGENLIMYEAEVETKYTGIETCSWNKNYDIVTVRVTTKVPSYNNYWYIGWKCNLFDMNGKAANIMPDNQSYKKNNKMQMIVKSYYADYLLDERHLNHYIYYRILIKKNEGAYLMHGGYDSVEHYQGKGSTNTEVSGGGRIQKDDIRKNYTFFYVSSKDAKKALGR